MSRLIDADDLPISYIDITDVGYYVSKYGQGIPVVYLEDIKDAPTIESEQRWIPCSERLPEKYIGKWLCSTSDGDVMILPYDTPGDGTKECVFYKWDDDGCYYQTFDVVAWKPLPEPFRGKTNDRIQS